MFRTKADISLTTPCLKFLTKEIVILLPYLRLQGNQGAKCLRSCVFKFYSFINLKIFFFFKPLAAYTFFTSRINRLQQTRSIYKANCWDCNGFYISKTKRQFHDKKTKHFKTLVNTSVIANHVKSIGHN